MTLSLEKAEALADSHETDSLTCEAARQSIVLLKNENSLRHSRPGSIRELQ